MALSKFSLGLDRGVEGDIGRRIVENSSLFLGTLNITARSLLGMLKLAMTLTTYDLCYSLNS